LIAILNIREYLYDSVVCNLQCDVFGCLVQGRCHAAITAVGRATQRADRQARARELWWIWQEDCRHLAVRAPFDVFTQRVMSGREAARFLALSCAPNAAQHKI
jgi:hypothetical protein